MSAVYPQWKASSDGAAARYTSPAAGEGTSGTSIKGARGKLIRLRTRNNAATAYTVMVFDKATAPVNGDTPIWRGTLPNVAGGELDMSFAAEGGLQVNNGLAVAISSTAGTLTLAAALDALFHALYV